MLNSEQNQFFDLGLISAIIEVLLSILPDTSVLVKVLNLALTNGIYLRDGG